MAKRAKRADGLMQKGFRVDGKQYTVYGRTERELLDKMAKKIAEIEAGVQTRKHPTLNEYQERWNEARKDSVKETTLYSHGAIYNQVKDVFIPSSNRKFGEIRLENITIDDLRIVQETMLLERSAYTTNQYMKLIKRIMEDARKERLIEYNPCCLLKPIKRTEDEARDTYHRPLTQEEQKAFFECERCKTSLYYNVYRLAINTGMRTGEIGALKLSDIRGDAIHVKRTLTRTKSGGVKIGTDAKTQAGQRQIPLNDEIRQILADQKTMNAMLHGNVLSMDETIFKNGKGEFITPTTIDGNIERICKDAGIEVFTMHAFRSTFATRAIDAGIPPKVLQELLGHKDISTTMNLYAHATKSAKEQAMQAVIVAI